MNTTKKAYILTDEKGNIQNENIYKAMSGFQKRYIDIEFFKEGDLLTLDIDKNTPVIAGISPIRQLLSSKGISIPNYEIPSGFEEFLGRGIKIITLSNAIELFSKGETFFIKPYNTHKLFNGFILDNITKLIDINGLPDNELVLISDIIEIVSEYRVFINENKIVGISNYNGDCTILPDMTFIQNAFSKVKDMPIAYSLDFGVKPTGETFFIEANDAFALGSYGLSSIEYSKMIENRWKELYNC